MTNWFFLDLYKIHIISVEFNYFLLRLSLINILFIKFNNSYVLMENKEKKNETKKKEYILNIFRCF